MGGSEAAESWNSWWKEVEPHRPRVSRWFDRLAWLGVILVAVAAFASEVGLCLAVALACLNFGRERFRVARWLKRHDPDRRRGKVCSRFYFAWGLWKITYVACLMAFFLAMIDGATREASAGSGKQAPMSPASAVALTLAMLGFPLTSFVTTLASIAALRHRVRIWLGPEAGWARQARRWPPHTMFVREPTTNSGKILLIVWMIAAGAVAILILAILLIFLTENTGRDKRLTPYFFVFGFLGSLIGGAIAILRLGGFLEQRIIAETPEDCWSIAVDSGRPEPSRGS